MPPPGRAVRLRAEGSRAPGTRGPPTSRESWAHQGLPLRDPRSASIPGPPSCVSRPGDTPPFCLIRGPVSSGPWTAFQLRRGFLCRRWLYFLPACESPPGLLVHTGMCREQRAARTRGCRGPAWLPPWPSDSRGAAPGHPEPGLIPEATASCLPPGSRVRGERGWRRLRPWGPVPCPPAPRDWPMVRGFVPAAHFPLSPENIPNTDVLRLCACLTNTKSQTWEGKTFEILPLTAQVCLFRHRLCLKPVSTTKST